MTTHDGKDGSARSAGFSEPACRILKERFGTVLLQNSPSWGYSSTIPATSSTIPAHTIPAHTIPAQTIPATFYLHPPAPVSPYSRSCLCAIPHPPLRPLSRPLFLSPSRSPSPSLDLDLSFIPFQPSHTPRLLHVTPPPPQTPREGGLYIGSQI